ncbi:UvrD-like helicase C-terminal domain-containing protein [Paenibacillus sp. UNCCL117]|nr:UvrD-like helicase C-terminal domain-containing protein [Paenibacillus sp. cl123]SFW60729.1 UvrD-like helicase C-terminal domain-containing protein [Paenibacillus sp. UNCCL117]
MEQNYRSTGQIVRTADAFIKRNKNRYDKNMFTANPAGKPVAIRSLGSYAYQANYLVRAGIPFYMKDADLRFFSHWVVEDVLNFMRMSYTDRRPDLLESIHMKLTGYISKKQISVLKETAADGESVFDVLLERVELQDYQRKPLAEAKETLRSMNKMPPREAIRTIRSRLGYEKAIDRMCERLGFRKEYLLGILNTLEDIAEPLMTLEEFAARLKQLEALLKQSRNRKNQNAVTCSTLHSSKGLEFRRVYMIDLIDGIIPSSEDKEKKGAEGGFAMEEAVRLFYVGMTRARSELELISYRERDGTEVAESPFVTAVRRIMNPDAESAGVESSGGAVARKKASAAGGGRREEQSQGHGGRRSLKPAVSRDVSGGGTGVRVVKTVARTSPRAIADSGELQPGRLVRHRVFGEGEIGSLSGDRIVIRFGQAAKTLSVQTCLEQGLLELADQAMQRRPSGGHSG